MGASALTRRGAIVAAGVAAVGADTAQAAADLGAWLGAIDLQFLARITQAGAEMVGVGYLTHVAGAEDGALFFPGTPSEATARLTFRAEGTAHGPFTLHNLIVLVTRGTMTFYLRDAPGASFGDPGSFARGRAVATSAMRLQSLTTVQAPGQGSSAITGSLHQRSARRFLLGGRRHLLGSRGAHAILTANGWSERSDPTGPRSTTWVAGSVVVTRA